jgi:hypothetical protein
LHSLCSSCLSFPKGICFSEPTTNQSVPFISRTSRNEWDTLEPHPFAFAFVLLACHLLLFFLPVIPEGNLLFRTHHEPECPIHFANFAK